MPDEPLRAQGAIEAAGFLYPVDRAEAHVNCPSGDIGPYLPRADQREGGFVIFDR